MRPEDFEPTNKQTFSPQDFEATSYEGSSGDPGFLKGLTQSVWKESGLAKMAASGIKLVQGISNLDASDEEWNKIMNEPVHFGEWLGDEKQMDSVLDAVGTGLKVGSMVAPLGEGKTIAGGVLKNSSFWQKSLPKFIANTAPFTVPMALGEGVQSLDKGKTAGQALGDTGISYLENIGGFGLIKGGAGLLKWGAKPLMESSFVKYASNKLGELADYTSEMIKKGASQEELKIAQNAYNKLHGDTIKEVGQILKSPDVEESTWLNVSRGVGNTIRKGYDAVSNLFKDKVYLPEIKIPVESSAKESIFKSIITNAQKGEGGEAVGDSLAKGYVNMGGKLGGLINDIAVQFKKGDFSLKSIDELWKHWGVGSADKVENQAMKNILMDVTSAGKQFLESTGDARHANILQDWDKASLAWRNVSQNLNGKFSGLLQTVANPREFVDKIFTTNPSKVAENIRQILTDVNLDPNLKQSMSQMLYNSVLEKAQNFSVDAATNGKALGKFLDNWSQHGILSPEHILKLRSYSDLLTGSFDDFARGVAELDGVPFKSVEELSSQAKNIAQETMRVKQFQKIEGMLKGEPLISKTEDGSLDMKNFLNVARKLQSEGEEGLDDVIKGVEQYEALTDKGSSKAKTALKLIIGGVTAIKHPIIGSGWIMSGLKDVMKNEAGKITKDEIAQLAEKIVADPESSIAKKFFYGVLGGQMPKTTTTVQRAAAIPVTQYLDQAKRILGRQPTKEEEDELLEKYKNEFGQ